MDLPCLGSGGYDRMVEPAMSSAKSFAEKLEELQGFFKLAADAPLQERIAAMNAAMGLVGEGPLPDQVDALLAATGIAAAAAPAATAAPAPAPAPASAVTSMSDIGTRPDGKLARHIAKHQAYVPKKPVDVRATKIDALRKLLEGGPDVPEFYRHADHIPGATQIAGGRSFSTSMVGNWESESYFKDMATALATKPMSDRIRDNPVSGKYPQFR